jgi:cytochrome c-type protein NapC
MIGTGGVLTIIAVVCGVSAAVILVVYLVRRPPLRPATKVWLFLGLGPLPIGAAMSANTVDFERTKDREFCGSCHVMHPYTNDAANRGSRTLAAAHSQSPYFGHESCYICHADYGMFGAVTTKIGGMHHVWDFYTKDWDGPNSRKPALYEPYDPATCQQCHPTSAAPFQSRLEHRVHAGAVSRGDASCISDGCHGPAHGRPGTGAHVAPVTAQKGSP